MRAPTRGPSPGSPTFFEARSRNGFGYARVTRSGRPPSATREPAVSPACLTDSAAEARQVAGALAAHQWRGLSSNTPHGGARARALVTGSPEAGKGSVGRTATPRVSGETAPPPSDHLRAHLLERPDAPQPRLSTSAARRRQVAGAMRPGRCVRPEKRAAGVPTGGGAVCATSVRSVRLPNRSLTGFRKTPAGSPPRAWRARRDLAGFGEGAGRQRPDVPSPRRHALNALPRAGRRAPRGCPQQSRHATSGRRG